VWGTGHAVMNLDCADKVSASVCLSPVLGMVFGVQSMHMQEQKKLSYQNVEL
jgi:hypothetical protein